MVTKSPKTEAEWHRKFAAQLFNSTWRRLEKKRRTREENDAIIHRAHASRDHWSVVGGPKELAIGKWQISHVYALLGRAEPSLYHAKRCLEICERNRIGDFPLAYAHEALARACALAGKSRLRVKHLRLAKEAGAEIAEDDDRALFFKDIRTVPSVRRA